MSLFDICQILQNALVFNFNHDGCLCFSNLKSEIYTKLQNKIPTTLRNKTVINLL